MSIRFLNKVEVDSSGNFVGSISAGGIYSGGVSISDTVESLSSVIHNLSADLVVGYDQFTFVSTNSADWSQVDSAVRSTSAQQLDILTFMIENSAKIKMVIDSF